MAHSVLLNLITFGKVYAKFGNHNTELYIYAAYFLVFWFLLLAASLLNFCAMILTIFRAKIRQFAYWSRPALLMKPLSKYTSLQGLGYADLILLADLQNNLDAKQFSKVLRRLDSKKKAKKANPKVYQGMMFHDA